MGHSQPEYYLHFVWATYEREPLLVGETEAVIYACLRAELRRMDCRVLALGGIADHVHLAVEPTTLLGPAPLMKQIKGVSSRFASSKGITFKWQAGYGLRCMGREHLAAAIHYIENQKRHHTDGTLWSDWEPTDD